MSDYKTFTSQDLMKAMGLQVGDKLKFIDVSFDNHIYQLVLENNEYLIRTDLNETLPLNKLINRGFKILPRPKRVGDLKCNNECFRNNGQCPIRAICSHCNLMRSDKTLYEFLEFYKDKKDKYANEVEFDQEIYDLLKARLDKEVEE